MIKKYLPYIFLLVGAIAFVFIKSHQRGPVKLSPERRSTERYKVTPRENDHQDFDRNVSRIIYSRHAKCRMECRFIDEVEVKEILRNGTINERKIETDNRGTTYPVEGISEGHHLRIVFAPKGEDAVEVVTCIDLDKEWPCNCN